MLMPAYKEVMAHSPIIYMDEEPGGFASALP